jgi:CheY-like chemotaxis protein/HPt (histidine-containing phosphotransfer) domain-containing protein
MASLRILLAENSLVARTAIIFQIQQLGHVVEVASNSDLPTRVNGQPYDVLLLDAGIRNAMLDETSFSIPVVGLLSAADPEDWCDGFDTVLIKPFTMAQLAEALQTLTNVTDRPNTQIQATELVERLGGKRDLLGPLTELLRQQAAGWQAQMAKAFAERDSELLRQTAHQAKGALANFAAAGAAHAARDLEEIARTGEWDRAATMRHRLEEMVAGVLGELTEMQAV